MRDLRPSGRQELDAMGCVHSIEVHTEAPHTAEGEAELEELRAALPTAVVLPSMELSWAWQALATADVLVMSNSAFSLSAALLNPNAFHVYYPNPKPSQLRTPALHWHVPADRLGTLPQSALDDLRARLAYMPGAALPAGAAAVRAVLESQNSRHAALTAVGGSGGTQSLEER
jgi:hypothetical protein